MARARHARARRSSSRMSRLSRAARAALRRWRRAARAARPPAPPRRRCSRWWPMIAREGRRRGGAGDRGGGRLGRAEVDARAPGGPCRANAAGRSVPSQRSTPVRSAAVEERVDAVALRREEQEQPLPSRRTADHGSLIGAGLGRRTRTAHVAASALRAMNVVLFAWCPTSVLYLEALAAAGAPASARGHRRAHAGRARRSRSPASASASRSSGATTSTPRTFVARVRGCRRPAPRRRLRARPRPRALRRAPRSARSTSTLRGSPRTAAKSRSSGPSCAASRSSASPSTT